MEAPARKPRRALWVVLRIVGAVLITGAGIFSAVCITHVADLYGFWMGVVSETLGVSEDTIGSIVFLFLLSPTLMLAGAVARPHWWVVAIAPLAGGLVRWGFAISNAITYGGGPGGAYHYLSPDLALLVGLHAGATGLGALLGWLGCWLSRWVWLRCMIVGLGAPWLAGGVTVGLAGWAIWDDLIVAPWAVVVGVGAGVVIVLLAAYWAAGAGRWWLLGIGAVLGGVWLVMASLVMVLFMLEGGLGWYMPWVTGAAVALAVSFFAFLAVVGKEWRLGRRVRFPYAAAVAAIACAGALVMSLPRLAARPTVGEERAAYIRIEIAPETTLYVEFKGDEVRLATSVEGLASVAPVKAATYSREGAEFTAVALPVGEEALPAGCKALRGSFDLISFDEWRMGGRMEAFCIGGVGFVYEDEGGVEWTYWAGRMGTDLGGGPERAPVMEAPRLGRLTMRVAAEPGREGEETVGLAVVVAAGEAEVGDIQKDGKSVEASLVVRDSAGRVVDRHSGKLDDVGYT